MIFVPFHARGWGGSYIQPSHLFAPFFAPNPIWLPEHLGTDTVQYIKNARLLCTMLPFLG